VFVNRVYSYWYVVVLAFTVSLIAVLVTLILTTFTEPGILPKREDLPVTPEELGIELKDEQTET